MAIPGFQSLLLPLLTLAGDDEVHTLSDSIEALAAEFSLSHAEREELLPSGKQPRFDNRVGWTKTHLTKALLLAPAGYGHFRITDRGKDVLRTTPAKLDMKALRRYPEYTAFAGSSQQHGTGNKQHPLDIGLTAVTQQGETAQTPQEILESSYQILQLQLAKDLLDTVKRVSPKYFEKLVVDLLLAMGYGGSRLDAGKSVGRTGDGGIDGIINEDVLGLDTIYIQAKRWDASVGAPVIHAFVGSLEGKKARKGVFITTSQFSQPAREFVTHTEKKVILIDGEQLATLMIDYGVGVSNFETYTIKKINPVYFEDAE
ncbi:MAG: restriction endonuclease [Chloroflexota bacterium]